MKPLPVFHFSVSALVLWASFVAGEDGLSFIIQYFSSNDVRMVISTLCNYESNIWLHRRLSERNIPVDFLDLKTFNESKHRERLRGKFYKLGVLVDLKCPRAMELLHVAEKHQLFSFGRSLTSWLILTRRHFSYEYLQASAESYIQNVEDPIAFLMAPYEDRTKEKYLLEVNEKINADFLKSYRESMMEKTPLLPPPQQHQSELWELWSMRILVDTEVALAIPGPNNKFISYEVYSMYKTTPESKPKLIKIGDVKSGVWNTTGNLYRAETRTNLFGGLLKAASAVFQPECFTTIDDVATRERDLWSKISYEHVRLLSKVLNFSLIIRYYDNYGWQTNGTFGHLIGQLQQKKVDLSGAFLLIRKDRLPVVHYLVCPFFLQVGILFREPPLSSVSNIFLRPFSTSVWISIGAIMLAMVLILRCRMFFGKRVNIPINRFSSYFEYTMGTICQQGFSNTPKSSPERIALIIFLLTSVTLFTSYSACIVALLQSSSSAISTISDITHSDMEVGIQANFPLYQVLIKEAVHPVLKEYYNKKVIPKGEKAFYDRREGIEKMRTGMFAFEVELTAGYKLISESYQEREKCGIRQIDLIPKPFICIAARKHSPYKEIFNQKLAKQLETGLFDRTWNMWADQKPKCEVGRIGFMSVGLTEFKPALQVFAYGVFASATFLVLELLYKRKYILKFLKQKNKKILKNKNIKRQSEAP